MNGEAPEPQPCCNCTLSGIDFVPLLVPRRFDDLCVLVVVETLVREELEEQVTQVDCEM